MEYRACAGRFVRRFLRGGCSGRVQLCARFRHRWLDPSAELLLRRDRHKPTYGTVSRYGLIAYGSSLDQIGPIAKDVTDCATILEAIASHDVKDSTSVQREDYDFTSALVDDVRGMKIGIPRDYFGDGLDPEVKVAVLGAAKKLEEKGAIVEEFDLSLVEYAIPAYYVIACAEASSNLGTF